MPSLSRFLRIAKLHLNSLRVPRGRRLLKSLRVDGLELLVFANEDVGRSLLVLGNFEQEEVEFLRTVIEPADICFDIGGNVGYFAMLMAQSAREGQIHVFEPIPLNAQIIRTNALLNRFDNLQVNNVALGNEPGFSEFSVSSDSAYSSLRATGRHGEAQSITVPVWTLDEYVDERGLGRIAIMKVDVEGAEEMVLKGATRLLSDPDRRPRLIMLELFDENLRPFGTSVAGIVERMNDLGYQPRVLRDGSLTPYRPEMANVIPNVFFLPA